MSRRAISQILYKFVLPQLHCGRSRAPDVLPLALCLAAFGLRLGPLWVNRFHSDEALYASWSLGIASGRDILLASASPDKPPLFFYTAAASFDALGRVEVAARLPGLISGVLGVALIWRLAYLLPWAGWPSRRLGAAAAALALALSPFAILFSPTAFLDPLMVTLGLAALLAAAGGQGGRSGLFLGLAAATKVQALVFGPLALALGMIVPRRSGPDPLWRRWRAAGARSIAVLALPLAAVMAWDRLRGGMPFWVQQTINYGGIRPVYASEVLPRLAAWAGFFPYFFGWPVLVLVACGLPLLVLYDLTRGARTTAAALDLALVAFSLAYFFLHWLLALPAWDRYMLGLVPVGCLLLARLVRLAVDLVRVASGWRRAVVGALVLALLLPPAVQASQSALPVGGDHGPHDGIDQVAAYLRRLPYGTVVYDHWLGWVLHYYLADSTSYIAYFATPQSLAEDLHVFGRTSPRYLVVPPDESMTRIQRAIAAEGFGLSPVLSTRDRRGRPTFVLYRLDPAGSPSASEVDRWGLARGLR